MVIWETSSLSGRYLRETSSRCHREIGRDSSAGCLAADLGGWTITVVPAFGDAGVRPLSCPALGLEMQTSGETGI